MTKRLSAILIGCVLGISLETSTLAQTATLHSIKGVGQARLQRERTNGWRAVRKGTAFRQGDQLWTEKGVIAYVKCPGSNITKKVVARRPKGLGAICRRWVSRDWRGSQSVSTLGGVDATIPYLITPRHSLILNSAPVLRWNPVEGSTEYTVIVSDNSGEIWKVQTPNAMLKYTGPTLIPGVAYRVTVMSNTGQSSTTDTAPTGNTATHLDFRLLRSQEAELIKSATQQIADVPSDMADILAIARLYRDFTLPESVIASYGLTPENYQTYSLTAEAIALLESVLKQKEPSALVYRMLGDLYWQTGLIQLASEQYQQSIQQTESLADLEDWTLSHTVLGQIYVITKDYPLALNSIQNAKAGYQFLGNDRLATQMQRRGLRLEKRLQVETDKSSQ